MASVLPDLRISRSLQYHRSNERSSHARPTVRDGGIAIMIAIAISGTVLFSSSQDSILFAVIAVAVVVALVSANLLPPKGTH